MYYIIDRFEGTFAVCESSYDESIINININDIKGNPKEGDLIFIKDNKYYVDIERTKELKENIKKRFNSFWK